MRNARTPVVNCKTRCLRRQVARQRPNTFHGQKDLAPGAFWPLAESIVLIAK